MTARLLKVLVQPVYVLDQDDDLTELLVQPVTLTAVQWRELQPEVWAREGARQVERQVQTPLGPTNPTGEPSRIPPLAPEDALRNAHLDASS